MDRGASISKHEWIKSCRDVVLGKEMHFDAFMVYFGCWSGTINVHKFLSERLISM